MTTMNMTPVKAAMGICSMSPEANNTKLSNRIEAVMPDSDPDHPI